MARPFACAAAPKGTDKGRSLQKSRGPPSHPPLTNSLYIPTLTPKPTPLHLPTLISLHS